MIAPARRVAFGALRAISTGRADLPAALDASRRALDDPRDRALVAEIVTGALRWRGALDHLIARVTRRPLDRLDPDVLDILRLSAYQLVHLSRVPPAAVVNDAVALTRTARKRSAAPLVNAALRTLERQRDALPLPPLPAPDRRTPASPEPLAYLAVTLSHPEWLAARWLRRYGFEAAAAWARFNNAAAPITLRANTLRTTVEDLQASLERDGIGTERGHYAPHSLIVRRGNPLRSRLANGGLFVVQEEPSQIVPLLVGARPGERILDACAAPGGKTVALAGDMKGSGLLVAVDIRERRIDVLRRTAASAGARIHVARADVTRAVPFRIAFDRVLVDAPCSGLGTLRRDPDIRWRRAEADLATFAAIQLGILGAVAPAVRPGGRLVYATCSSEPEENEDVVDRFLALQPAFTRHTSVAADLPASVSRLIDQAGHLRTYPHEHDLEAFFAAVLIRRGR